MPKQVYRIAVAIPKYGLTGGAEGFAAELCQRIARHPRYEIHVFANKWVVQSDRITFHKVPLITFPKFLTTLSFAWFAGRLISKMNFDLVHAHDRLFDADIFTMHGIPHRVWVREVRGKRMSLYDYATDWVERTLVTNKKCRHFLAVSGLAKEKFLQAYGGTAPRMVQVVPPGVDAERFQKLDRELCRREIREAFRIGADDTVILFVSMNFDIKGLDRLMTALAALKSGLPNEILTLHGKTKDSEKFRLLVVGKGNIGKYKGLAERLGIADQIVFAGILEKTQLEKAYLASDIFSILSRFDTFGMVALEAMAASLPVIVSSNVGARDMVQSGVNGFIINEEDDPAEISGKIALLFDRERRLSMGKEAYATALAYTWEKAAKITEDIYETACNYSGR